MTHLLRAALTVCAVTLAACSPHAPPDGPRPAAWTAESNAGEMARWARNGCRRAPGGSVPCIERTLVGLIGPAGVGKSMEVLDTLLVLDADVRRNGHELAHGVGIAAYRGPETMAASFVACPATQGAGCKHGIIQGYFLSLLADGRMPGTPELDGVCEPHRGSTFLYFQCAHAVGHGLMAVHDNHVPMSLDGCDLATEDFIREGCYGGVFMENILHVTHPHNTTGGHAAAAEGHASGKDAHREHDGHASADQQPMAHAGWKALDPADPLYPCNVVADVYQPACYTMQTGAVLHFNRGDLRATARACERAPEAMLPVCFGSLGRDIIAIAALDHGRTLEMCDFVADGAEGRGGTWCMVGAVQNLANLAASADEGMRFCRLVETDDDKAACYRAVGELVYSFAATEELRHASCQAAETPFVEACRLGAALQPAETQSGEAP